MARSYFHRVQTETPTRFWVNNPTVKEAQLAIDAGAVSCTTNPTYVSKMLVHPEMEEISRKMLVKAAIEEPDDSLAASSVQAMLVKKIIEVFADVYRGSGGTDGWVSLQGDPQKDDDPDEIIREAETAMKLGLNCIAKIPVTKSGIDAIKPLVEEGVPAIATEVMSISQAMTICEAYIDAIRGKKKPTPFYVTHITGIFDQHLENWKKTTQADIGDNVLCYAGILVARKQYKMLKERKYPVVMLGGGARRLQHFTEFVGADMHITINWKGTADKLLAEDRAIENNFEKTIRQEQDIVEELLAKVPVFKAAWEEDGLSVDEYAGFPPVDLFRSMFINGWEKLLAEIRKFRSEK